MGWDWDESGTEMGLKLGQEWDERWCRIGRNRQKHGHLGLEI